MFKKLDLSICNEYSEQFWDVRSFINIDINYIILFIKKNII